MSRTDERFYHLSKNIVKFTLRYACLFDCFNPALVKAGKPSLSKFATGGGGQGGGLGLKGSHDYAPSMSDISFLPIPISFFRTLNIVPSWGQCYTTKNLQ